jgi:hypothetical protein
LKPVKTQHAHPKGRIPSNYNINGDFIL